jgi:hypothetical protein
MSLKSIGDPLGNLEISWKNISQWASKCFMAEEKNFTNPRGKTAGHEGKRRASRHFV